MQPIIPVDKVPDRAATRKAQFVYPWEDLKPGECFQFSPQAKVSSARVMCANQGADLQRRFRCFLGTDGKVYAQRVDGWAGAEPKVRITQAPRPAQEPETAEDFGTFGAGMTAANLSTIKDPPPAGPPLPPPGPSASQLRADAINAERDANVARLKALGLEDDVI